MHSWELENGVHTFKSWQFDYIPWTKHEFSEKASNRQNMS